jgi:hypothetical protein
MLASTFSMFLLMPLELIEQALRAEENRLAYV